jgi:general stress protein 26
MDDKVKNLIENSNYFTIATTNNMLPLVTPVFFVSYQGNFYWVSSIESNHSKNIESNPNVSIVIFDTNDIIGEGFGLYMIGTVSILLEEIETIDEIMRIKCESDEVRTSEYYQSPNIRRIYKFVPKEMWTNTQVIENGQLVDKRLYI